MPCSPLFPYSVSNLLPQNLINLLHYHQVQRNREAKLQAQINEATLAAEAVAITHAEQLKLLAKHSDDLKKSWEEEKTQADEAERRNKVLQ